MKKSDGEIMEILEAFDVTGCAHSAARLAGVDGKTVRSYVAARDTGRAVTGPVRRERLIDPFLAKVEEWVYKSQGSVRADDDDGFLTAADGRPRPLEAATTPRRPPVIPRSRPATTWYQIRNEKILSTGWAAYDAGMVTLTA